METSPQPNTTSPSDAYWKIEVCENRTEQKGEMVAWLTRTKTSPSSAARLAFSDLCNTPHSHCCRCSHQDQAGAWQIFYWPHPNTSKPRDFLPGVWSLNVIQKVVTNEKKKSTVQNDLRCAKWRLDDKYTRNTWRTEWQALQKFWESLFVSIRTDNNYKLQPRRKIYISHIMYLPVLIHLITCMQLIFLLLSYGSFLIPIFTRVTAISFAAQIP